MCGNFDDEEDRIEVRDIVKQWRELRSAGTSAEDYMTGTLDTAFDRFDSDRVTELFPDVIDLNVRFLRVANPVLESLVEAGDTRTQRA